MNKYTERLIREWRQHGKVIIAVDYDSTISYWPTIDNQDDIKRVINILQIAYQTGAYIVVFTACNPDRYVNIQEHCEEIKLPISGINTTPIDLPYGNQNKIYANVFLDDRAGLQEALNILETAMYVVRGDKMSTDNEIWCK